MQLVQHEGRQHLCHALIFSAVNREKVEPYTVFSRINVKKYLFLSIYIDIYIYMKRKIYKPEVHNVKGSEHCQQCHLEGSDQEYT